MGMEYGKIHTVDDESKERLLSIAAKIDSLNRMLRKVDKPTWGKVNGYLKTVGVSSQPVVFEINRVIERCESIEVQMRRVVERVRFDKHKVLFQKVANEASALKIAIQLTE